MDRLKEKPIDDQQSRFVEYLLVFLRVHTNQHFYTTNNQVYTNTHRLEHTAKLNSHLSLSLSLSRRFPPDKQFPHSFNEVIQW